MSKPYCQQIHHAGGKRTQAPLCFANISQSETVVRGFGVASEPAKVTNHFNIKCIAYNVEAMSMDRLRQITTELRKAEYDIAMIQGTRCNLSGSLWSNGYKVYNAPAAKTSTEAHAGVSIIIDRKILHNTRTTQEISLAHRK